MASSNVADISTVEDNPWLELDVELVTQNMANDTDPTDTIAGIGAGADEKLDILQPMNDLAIDNPTNEETSIDDKSLLIKSIENGKSFDGLNSSSSTGEASINRLAEVDQNETMTEIPLKPSEAATDDLSSEVAVQNESSITGKSSFPIVDKYDKILSPSIEQQSSIVSDLTDNDPVSLVSKVNKVAIDENEDVEDIKESMISKESQADSDVPHDLSILKEFAEDVLKDNKDVLKDNEDVLKGGDGDVLEDVLEEGDEDLLEEGYTNELKDDNDLSDSDSFDDFDDFEQANHDEESEDFDNFDDFTTNNNEKYDDATFADSKLFHAYLTKKLNEVFPDIQEIDERITGDILGERSSQIFGEISRVPRLKPQNWLKLKIRHNLLLNLGIPINLDEVNVEAERNLNATTIKRARRKSNLQPEDINWENFEIPDFKGLKLTPEQRIQHLNDTNEKLSQIETDILNNTSKQFLTDTHNEELVDNKLAQLQHHFDELLELSSLWNNQLEELQKNFEIYESVVQSTIGYSQKLRRDEILEDMKKLSKSKQKKKLRI